MNKIKPRLEKKLYSLFQRYTDVSHMLSDSTVIANQTKFRTLSQEFAQLEPIVSLFQDYQKIRSQLETTYTLISEEDGDLRLLAQEEMNTLNEKLEKLNELLAIALLPKDPNDERNIFLEIRAGTGGHEAALFSGDLFRMYQRYCENKHWKTEVLSVNESEQGGFKEVIMRITGDAVYSHLKFESGAHRVQRVPITESQGRLHTSACTVAVLPEAESIDHIDINPSDLRIDTYRASGAGGQHVNRTDSAVRITHFPSGLVVECQDERSQHKNKARALSLLKSRLLDQVQKNQQQEQAATRKSLVGSGDRSERIRTYNFPQSRVTDHRIQLTVYALDDILNGELDIIIDPLIRELKAEQLALVDQE